MTMHPVLDLGAWSKDYRKLRIEHKLAALRAMSRALDDLIRRCEGGQAATDDCPILAALEAGLHEVSP